MTNYAISGTYKIHRTESPAGTLPKKVKPACGQSTSRSFLSVTTEENVKDLRESGLGSDCKKCFG